MNTSTKIDFEDMNFILEGLLKHLPKMKRSERIDVAARIRAVVKSSTTILDEVKDEIKAVRPGEGDYFVSGEQWKAKVALVPSSRLDQKLLKEKEPKVYAKYIKDGEDVRVTFEPR
jgi:hypothetical protein